LEISRGRKAESTKQKYDYLKLNDDQAKQLSIIEDLAKKQLKIEKYKGYDPNLIKPEFKDVLTTKQFELYKTKKEEEYEKSIQSQIAQDADKTDEYLDLEQWITFQTSNILPIKCKILKELTESVSKDDLLSIEQIKIDYEKAIDDKISNTKMRHINRYGSQLPNMLKLKLIQATTLDINPSPSILTHLDLNKNEFSSINLTDSLKAELINIGLQQREFNIKRLEKKLKGSYASLMASNRMREIPEYLELYSILMLETEPQKNIDKMKMRQKTHGIL